MSRISEGAVSAAPRPLWRRPRVWVLGILALLAAWFVLTALLAGYHGYRTYTSAKATAAALSEGDSQAARDSIAAAQSNAAAARANLDGLPFAVFRVIPYVNTNLTAAEDLLDAAVHGLDAGAVVVNNYGEGPLVEGQRVNLTAVNNIEPHLAEVSAHVEQAQAAIADSPSQAAAPLREATQKVQRGLTDVQKGLQLWQDIGSDLPTLLGSETPQTYLVVFHNPAELYAGGGASLNVALVTFDDGQIEVGEKGAVSRDFFFGNPSVPWDPVAGGPYYATKNATDGFAWSNLHQDFRVAGEDMMRSWQANGGKHVDGVISLDAAALAAAVRVTGPIQSPLYGEITADNLIEKLFFEGYNEDPVAQAERQRINQELISQMLARMEGSGTQAASIARAIFSTAPGQHIRAYLSDGRHADALHKAGLDGAQPDPQPDRIAFYTQNQNASKVDIFQTRQLVHEVTLAADGSAQVTQTATVTNNAPAEGGSPLSDRIGYTTRWAFHWNITLLPDKATDIQQSIETEDVKRDDKVYTDVDGRKAVRIGGWIPPGGHSTITVTYRLPAGTFGIDGNLAYRASVEHQLLVNDVALTVNVTGPSQPTPTEGNWSVDSNTATSQFAVTEPTTIGVRFGR